MTERRSEPRYIDHGGWVEPGTILRHGYSVWSDGKDYYHEESVVVLDCHYAVETMPGFHVTGQSETLEVVKMAYHSSGSGGIAQPQIVLRNKCVLFEADQNDQGPFVAALYQGMKTT